MKTVPLLPVTGNVRSVTLFQRLTALGLLSLGAGLLHQPSLAALLSPVIPFEGAAVLASALILGAAGGFMMLRPMPRKFGLLLGFALVCNGIIVLLTDFQTMPLIAAMAVAAALLFCEPRSKRRAMRAIAPRRVRPVAVTPRLQRPTTHGVTLTQSPVFRREPLHDHRHAEVQDPAFVNIFAPDRYA